MFIRVDTREPKWIYPYLVERFPDIEFSNVCLTTGDFSSVPDDFDSIDEQSFSHVIVERKKLSDLNGSILDKRLINQFDRLAIEQGVIYLLLVVGNLDEYVEKVSYQKNVPDINAEMLLGAIASISCRYGCNVLWIEDDHKALDVMVKFIKSVETGKYMVPAKRDVDALCARLLGIQMFQWRILKSEYGTLEDIASIDTKKFEQIPGIGPARSKKIKSVLTEVL